MIIHQQVADKTSTLGLEGRFDFHSHRDFRAAYEPSLANADVHEIVLDFNQVDYLDSSALGMLLLLREKAEAAGKKVKLAHLSGSVQQVIEIANFGKLFTIE
jgi:anti-anti-sigma factor